MRNRLVAPPAEEDEQEINITPMLDVVFIMLIFFIVTASFVKESGIDVNKPEAQTSTPHNSATVTLAPSRVVAYFMAYSSPP